MNDTTNFIHNSKDLSRNPLGIIALFIGLVYGFACLLFGFAAKYLVFWERIPFVWFSVVFPLIVLILFAWLVRNHHDKLYGPRDYRDDESFLKTFRKSQNKEQTTVADPKTIADSKTIADPKTIESLMKHGEGFKTIDEQENFIKEDLTKNNLDYANNKTAQILIRHLAVSQMQAWFEKTYATIYGSQISMIKFLNKYKDIGIKKKDLEQYFNSIKKSYNIIFPEWSFDQYLNYLFLENLIVEKNDTICITVRGVDFLGLMLNYGYSEYKAG